MGGRRDVVEESAVLVVGDDQQCVVPWYYSLLSCSPPSLPSPSLLPASPVLLSLLSPSLFYLSPLHTSRRSSEGFVDVLDIALT